MNKTSKFISESVGHAECICTHVFHGTELFFPPKIPAFHFLAHSSLQWDERKPGRGIHLLKPSHLKK